MAVINSIAGGPTQEAAALAALIANITSRGNVTTSGDIGNRYTWLSLGRAGASAAAVVSSVFERSTAPGYKHMLLAGETSLAENWYDTASDSHNHAMLGHVDEYFYMYVAGIQRGSGGGDPWSDVRVAPMLLPGVDWVEASFDSPQGLIRSKWSRQPARLGARTAGETIVCEVELPPGARGRLVLPRSGREVELHPGAALHRDDGPQ